MKLTAVSPCYQEIRFIKGWLENCRRFADHVIISEGGSTDGTREIINEYWSRYPGWITLLEHPQSSEPHKYHWAEGERRRAMCSLITEGYIVSLDIDEMLCDDFRIIAEGNLSPKYKAEVYCLNYWRSPIHIRLSTPADPRWNPDWLAKIFPAGSLQPGLEGNHAPLSCSLPAQRLPNAILYHYHFLFMDKKPAYDNRQGELLGANPPHIPIGFSFIKHPDALQYITETVNFKQFADIYCNKEAKT